jgi:hypothetical protein
MMSLNSVDLIENEFKLLATAAGKRYTNIKEVSRLYLCLVNELIQY